MIRFISKFVGRFRKKRESIYVADGHAERRVSDQDRRKTLTYVAVERRSGTSDRRRRTYRHQRLFAEYLRQKKSD